MKKTMILIMCTSILVAPSISQKKFEIDANFYNDSRSEINNVEIVNTSKNTVYRRLDQNFSLKAKGSNGDLILSEEVPITFSNFVRTKSGGFEIEQEKVNSVLYVAYDRDISRFEIYENGQKKSEFKLKNNICVNDGKCSDYCKERGVDIDCTCGDGVCQEHENEELCSEDCSTSSGDPSKDPSNQSNEESGNGFQWLYVVIGVLVTGLLIVIFRSDI